MFKKKGQVKLKLSTNIPLKKVGPESPAPPLTAAPFHQETYPNGPLLIDNGLYLGSQSSAENIKRMTELGISCVISVAQELCVPQNTSSQVKPSSTTSNSSFPPLISSLSLEDDRSLRPPFSHQSFCPSPPQSGRDDHQSLGKTRCSRSDSAVSFSSPQSQVLSPNSTVSGDSDSLFSITSSSPISRRLDHACSQANISRHAFPWTHTEDITSSIDSALEIILAAQSAGRFVLIHCQQGVSRSAALVIAYMMKTKHMSFRDAYNYVKTQSPIISPNMTLISQLVELETRWGISSN